MSNAVWLEVRRGVHRDDVTLMEVSRDVGAVGGVDAALVAMATAMNIGLLEGLGFDPAEAGPAGPDDLLIAVRADDDRALKEARGVLEAALAPAAAPAPPPRPAHPPRTVRSAALLARADIALLSVPGAHVLPEARDALRAGLHVMIVSDDVPLDAEVALKEEAAARELLVMGPDCSTALIGGVALGFMNAVRPGPVGIVAASGTGAQQLACLLDEAGTGLRAVIGVGGRDLSAEVGARSTLHALAMLDEDPDTEHIVVVSKTPAHQVADTVEAAAAACATPVTLAFLGSRRPDLTTIAGEVTGRPLDPRWIRAPVQRGLHPGRLLGLFAGGSLAQEAAAIVPSAQVTDFGGPAYTDGRPHPIIDQRARIAAIGAAGPGDVLLLDVMLGHGGHPDPASELAPAIAAAVQRGAAAVVSLCATTADPQGRDAQATQLIHAGASVHLSNAHAVRKAAELNGARALAPPPVPRPLRMAAVAGSTVKGGVSLERPPATVAAGLPLLARSLREQGAGVTEVDWRPPVPGMGPALATLDADAPNQRALRRMLAARPQLVDVVPAREAVPALDGRALLHAGPPTDWDAAAGPVRGAIVGALLYEAWVDTPEQAEAMAARGEVTLLPSHAHGAVGPLAGVVSPSMPLWVVHDAEHGTQAHCALGEGPGKALRQGDHGTHVLERLRWIEGVLGPAVGGALRRHGPLDVRALVAQAVQMGDDLHQRTSAATALLLRRLAADLVETGATADVFRYVDRDERFFLCIGMAAAKAAADAAREEAGSSLVVAMAGNGSEFGVQLSGTGDTWFTAAAADAGDDPVLETAGLGGLATTAAAPAMYEITLAEHPAYQLPAGSDPAGPRGTPTGIDAALVVRTGLVPALADLPAPPIACFAEAVRTLAFDRETARETEPAA